MTIFFKKISLVAVQAVRILSCHKCCWTDQPPYVVSLLVSVQSPSLWVSTELQFPFITSRSLEIQREVWMLFSACFNSTPHPFPPDSIIFLNGMNPLPVLGLTSTCLYPLVFLIISHLRSHWGCIVNTEGEGQKKIVLQLKIHEIGGVLAYI